MVMKSGENWRCVNPLCGCAVVVESGGKVDGHNPRCACGSVMKKNYSPPVFHYLDFLKLPSPELVRSDATEE